MAGVGGIRAVEQLARGCVPALFAARSPDPFANVNPTPSDMHCVGSELNEDTNVAALQASGTNCWSSLKVGSNKSLTLPSGTYYINGGDAFIQGDLTCTACTIVLTNTSTAATPTIGQFKVNADAKVNLTAPTTGTFQGIAIFQDRRAQDSNQDQQDQRQFRVADRGRATIFRSQQLDYNGTGTTDAVCTMFVARRLKFSGNSTTTNKFKKLSDCSAYGIPSGGKRRAW